MAGTPSGRPLDLWIGTRGGGLIAGEGEDSSDHRKASPDQVTRLRRRSGGFGGTRGGLNRIADGRIVTYTQKDGLTEDAIVGLHADREGSLWIGTVGGGLNRFHAGRFTAMRVTQGLSNNSVHAFWEDSEGSRWIGTSGGLNRLRPGVFTTYSASEGLSAEDVRPVLETARERLDRNLGAG